MSRALRGQDGSAIVEFVWLGLLLLVPLLYVVLAVFEAQRTAYAASTAARSAGRAFVGAPSVASGYERAQAAARLAFRDQGLVLADDGLRITCVPDPDRCLVPGSVVLAEVRASARLPLVPDFLGDVPRVIPVTAENRSPYGEFRQERR